MHLKSFFNQLFAFTSKEKRGILLVILLILFIIIFKFINVFDIYQDDEEDQFYALDEKECIDSADTFHIETRKPYTTIPEGLIIDPNIATNEEWKQLGLNERQIRTVRNYLLKGGHFYRVEDIGKIYGISDSMCKIILPHLYIAEIKYEKTISNKEKASVQMIELNRADSMDLITLNGIGPVLAQRVIRYRNKLGGFYSIDQMKEVYGLHTETFDLIKDLLIADTSKIVRRKLSYESLKNHPYIDNYQAQAVMAYRNTKGTMASLEELVANHILPDSTARKIRYYFVFE